MDLTLNGPKRPNTNEALIIDTKSFGRHKMTQRFSRKVHNTSHISMEYQSSWAFLKTVQCSKAKHINTRTRFGRFLSSNFNTFDFYDMVDIFNAIEYLVIMLKIPSRYGLVEKVQNKL